MSIEPDVRARVRQLLSDYLGGQPLPDDLAAEPIAMRAGTAVVYLRLVDTDPPVVRIFSPLLREITSTPELLAELNELNSRLNFLRLFWRAQTVYAATEQLAATLDAPELAYACDAVADTADYYDVRLHAKYGGQIAFAERHGGADRPT